VVSLAACRLFASAGNVRSFSLIDHQELKIEQSALSEGSPAIWPVR